MGGTGKAEVDGGRDQGDQHQHAGSHRKGHVSGASRHFDFHRRFSLQAFSAAAGQV
jgi:hypothetical protein